MKKLLWIAGTIIAGILWFVLVGFIGFGVTIITRSSVQSANANFWGVVICIGWAALVIISIAMWKRWKFKCQACKRWGALRLEKTELLKQEQISVLVELERRNLNRDIIGTQDQYIPGKRKIYRDTYKCKFCGGLETRKRTTKSADL